MSTVTALGREFWTDVVTRGGATAIPRWTDNATPGVAERTVVLPDNLRTALRKLGAETGVPASAILLAAHAKVLAALAGQDDVVAGYVALPGGPPLPCPLTTRPVTWRDMLREVRGTEAALLPHHGYPVDDLARELGEVMPSFETVCDPIGEVADPPADAVLTIGWTTDVTGPALRVRYRTAALDAQAVARILGYHLTALSLMASDPDADHRSGTLLGVDEVDFQIQQLAGPDRPLPDRRFHQLVEEQAARHPGRVVAEHAGRCWTYQELNARANRAARALLTHGLVPEAVVAVLAERTLDWMAAVLAIAKAGGAYLPIEPTLPPARVAGMLSQAGCRIVLTQPTRSGLEQDISSLPGVEVLDLRAAHQQGDESNLDLAVGPDQLAYIFFTSGSTGEPKGAMCEHAGLLNHLLAKVEDLRILPRQVVAQTAPVGFDISLWQLWAAPLTGGRTLLVEQDAILDVDRFLDTIAAGRVSVLQVVPSYLEAVLSHLERQPRTLRDLRCVSVTGEALPAELARRWFAAQPGIPLVNAYGLTETSDDTNHEVLDRAPVGDRVSLGRPVRNVRLYLVDDDLAPVPLGAPGEIVFSGVCVGRGYVNDPDRTRQAFLADPHRPGERLYRSGDHGRWSADGKLEFLGRRDSQVKVRGFRIEIGEVESVLERVPGIRHAAVVVAAVGGAQDQQLVAFWSGPEPLPPEHLRRTLGASLAPYMVPTSFHQLERLPLTANGKTDRNALTLLAMDTREATDRQVPTTPAEQRVADAWAAVLGLSRDQIGRLDDFFDRGGTSLAAVRLVTALDRAVSLREVTRNPVLADLAGLLDDPSPHPSAVTGAITERTLR